MQRRSNARLAPASNITIMTLNYSIQARNTPWEGRNQESDVSRFLVSKSRRKNTEIYDSILRFDEHVRRSRFRYLPEDRRYRLDPSSYRDTRKEYVPVVYADEKIGPVPM